MKINDIVTESLRTENPCWKGYHPVGTKKKAGKTVPNCVPGKSIAEDLTMDTVYVIYVDGKPTVRFKDKQQAIDTYADLKKEFLTKKVEIKTAQHPRNSFSETAAWRRKEGKNKTGGLNAKGVASYRRENPGSKLQTAVTTKPSKLKPGSKAAKRRKSFCARMSGVKGPMKKPNGDPTRKALALRKWNCESVEHMVDMIIENMSHSKDNQAVPELKSALLAKKSQLQAATDDQVYDIIDSIMTRIAKSHGISGQKLHDMWVAEYDQVPDTWIMK